MVTEKQEYGARHLQVLEGLEAVRKRPGMYIGSTDQRGLMHCLWEIIDNSVDEALGDHCTEISVELHPDGSVEVKDDGRGIPVDIEPRTGLSGVEVVFTRLHAGGKFGSGTYAASGGLHGVGASVVNALAERLDVEVDRGAKTYRMSFHRGEPGLFKDKGEPTPDAPFTAFAKASELQIVGKAPRGRTGTRVRYWPDPQVFGKKTDFVYEDLLARVRQTSFLVPGLKIKVADRRPVAVRLAAERQLAAAQNQITTEPAESMDLMSSLEQEQAAPDGLYEEFLHSGGVVDFADYLAPDPPITDTWLLTGTGKFTETVPVLDASGHMVSTEVERECEVNLALRWGVGYETEVRSFVNIIATPKGGTHLTGFEAGLVKVIRKVIDANARKHKISSKDSTERIEKDDILAGLTAVLTVRLAEPQFEGQTKEVLGTAPVRAIVSRIVEKELGELLNSSKRDLKNLSSLLQEKIVSEMRARVHARKQKEISRRKNALETSSLPPKLVDCRSDDIAESELFIVEGDSALGTAKLARSSQFQALLPIRGKILNVQRVSLADMLNNAECAAIIQVIGAGSGRSFDLETLRYGKIIIMTDADVDGAHIRTLLLTLFFRYMRPLLDAGRIYAAVPPLHRITLSAVRGKPTEHIYTYSEEELTTTLKKLDRSGRKYSPDIQRYKGLGEMDADQLATTTMDPNMRTLRRVTMSDAARAENIFEMLMGQEVGPRKDFIVSRANELDYEKIDA